MYPWLHVSCQEFLPHHATSNFQQWEFPTQKLQFPLLLELFHQFFVPSISKKGAWTPLSPSKELSLRWGKGKKEQKPNPHGLQLQFYWKEALVYKAVALCAVLEHSHSVIWIQAILEHSWLSVSHSPRRHPLETLLLMLSKPRSQTLF